MPTFLSFQNVAFHRVSTEQTYAKIDILTSDSISMRSRLWFSIVVNRATIIVEGVTGRIKSATRMAAELSGWKAELADYERWYDGRIILHGLRSPNEREKETSSDDKRKNACMTWNLLFQQRNYLSNLLLDESAFSGMTILDVGSGPHPNALCFKDCEVFGLDHLMKEYAKIGFPTKDYEERYHFVNGRTEKMPFPNGFFDAVIAVNALDHLDDLPRTSREIMRVLKPDGLIRFIVEYHASRPTEPIEVDDEVIRDCFSWVDSLHKVYESPIEPFLASNYLSIRPTETGAKYVVWSSF